MPAPSFARRLGVHRWAKPASGRRRFQRHDGLATDADRFLDRRCTFATILAGPALAQKSADTLRVTWRTQVTNVDPYYNPLRNGLVLALTRLGWAALRDPTTFQIRGLLASEWHWEDDRTLAFTLRPGVTFQNGDRFTADDVVYTINTVAADKTISVPEQLSVPRRSRKDRRPACPREARARVSGRNRIHRHGVADLAEGLSRARRRGSVLPRAGRQRPVSDHQTGRRERDRSATIRRLFRGQPQGPARDRHHRHPSRPGSRPRSRRFAERARRLDLAVHA